MYPTVAPDLCIEQTTHECDVTVAGSATTSKRRDALPALKEPAIGHAIEEIPPVQRKGSDMTPTISRIPVI